MVPGLGRAEGLRPRGGALTAIPLGGVGLAVHVAEGHRLAGGRGWMTG